MKPELTRKEKMRLLRFYRKAQGKMIVWAFFPTPRFIISVNKNKDEFSTNGENGIRIDGLCVCEGFKKGNWRIVGPAPKGKGRFKIPKVLLDAEKKMKP